MIYIAADHAGFELKKKIVVFLESRNIDHRDLGADQLSIDDDYPDYANKLVAAMNVETDLGILICGSGQGVCIAANKHKGVRAAQAWSVETARLARQDDKVNILCLAGKARNIGEETLMVETFLSTRFDEIDRRTRRLDKLARLDH